MSRRFEAKIPAIHPVQEEQAWLTHINDLKKLAEAKIEKEQKKYRYPHGTDGHPVLTSASQCYSSFTKLCDNELKKVYEISSASGEDAGPAHEALKKAHTHINNIWSDISSFLQLTRSILDMDIPLAFQDKIVTQMTWLNEAIKNNDPDKIRQLFLATFNIVGDAIKNPSQYQTHTSSFYKPSPTWDTKLNILKSSFNEVEAKLVIEETKHQDKLAEKEVKRPPNQ